MTHGAREFASAVGALREQLAELRESVTNGQQSVDSSLGMASRALGQLSAERADLLRQASLLRESAADRAKVEATVRRQLDVSDGLSTRQRGEIERLQALLASRDARIAELETSSAGRMQQTSLPPPSPGTGSRGTTGGAADERELRRLRGELSSAQAFLSAAREEAEAAAATTSARVAEIQEACQAKIQSLRQAYETQLMEATAQQDPSPQASEASTDLVKGLRTKVAELQAVADSARAEAQCAQAASAQAAQDAERRATAAESSAKEAAEGASAAKRVEAQLRIQLQEALAQAQAVPPPASGGGVGGLDADLLAQMEANMLRLSGLLRSKEAELGTLRETVQAQCQERADLQKALDEALRLGSLGIPPAVAGSAGGPGGGPAPSARAPPGAPQAPRSGAPGGRTTGLGGAGATSTRTGRLAGPFRG